MSKTNEYVSPITNTKYTIYEVSPLVLSLVNEQSETEETTSLRLDYASLAKTAIEDNETLKRADLDESMREAISTRLKQNTEKLAELKKRIAFKTRLTPKTVCEVLRTFVKECDGKTDLEIMRLGKDFDLLYNEVTNRANHESDQYLSLFRQQQAAGNKPSASG